MKTKKLKNYPIKFSIGDIVEATDEIRRVDGKSILHNGFVATVRSVSDVTGTQIIGLNIQGQLPMNQIVCFEDVPLKLVKYASL